MKNIHGKDTKIEVILRKALWEKGIGIVKIIKAAREPGYCTDKI